MKKPHIAFIHDWLTTFGGAEQVLLAAHELYPEAPIYTSLYRPQQVPQFANANVIPSYLQQIPGASSHHQLYVPLVPAAFESFDLKEYDAVVSFGLGFSKGVLTQPHQPHLSYCHSPARYLWNLGGDMRNKGRWDSWLRAKAEHSLRVWDVVTAERVDAFVANSQNTARRIEKIYRRSSEVIHPPVNIERFQISNQDKKENYILSVGRLVAYKRVDLIIEASLKVGLPLRIVGCGPEERRLRQIVGNSPLITFLGFVSEEELVKQYQHAKAAVFAAEEDFGIVPVEAMAAGCPVVAYGQGGVGESVIPDKTGILFTQQNIDSLAEAFSQIDTFTYDLAILHAHAEGFSSEVFKEKIGQFITEHI